MLASYSFSATNDHDNVLLAVTNTPGGYTLNLTINGSSSSQFIPSEVSTLPEVRLDLLDGNDSVSITSNSIAITVLGRAGDDVVTLVAPTSGSPLMGQVALVGGADNDALLVNGTSSTLVQSYHILAQPVVGDVVPIDATLTANATILRGDADLFDITTGSGNDLVRLDTITTPTLVNATTLAGNDRIELRPTDRNLSTSITQLLGGTLDGGTGNADRFIVSNEGTTDAWLYTIQPDQLRVESTAASTYDRIFSTTNIEQRDIIAGFASNPIQANIFQVLSTKSGVDERLLLQGGAGREQFQLGDGTSLDLIRSRVSVVGGGGNDTILANDSADTTADTLHIANRRAGDFLGDSFFGTGGSVEFSEVELFDVTMPTISGPTAPGNRVFARQNPTMRISLDGRNTTDSLVSVSVAGIAGSGFLGTALNGSVVSPFHQNVEFFNFGQLDFGVNIPTVVSTVYDFDAPQPQIRVKLSAAVGALPPREFIAVRNFTTNTNLDSSQFVVLPGTALDEFIVRFNSAKSVPADGNYRIAISAIGVYDAQATPLFADIDSPFYVLGGDADRNRTVNFNDLVLLARNFNQSGRTFSQGDFNYDGVVNFSDLVILARNFNRTLSAIPGPVFGLGSGSERRKLLE
jgi:hypothetical protein